MHYFKQLIGPVITLAIVLLTYFLAPYISVSFGWAFVAIVWTAYIGGLLPTIISLIIILITMGIIYPPDYGRLIQSGLSITLIGTMVIALKRKALMTESLNGNIKRLKESLDITRDLLINWDDMSDNGRQKRVRLIEDKLGNLAALVYGWHKIRQEIDETKAEFDHDSSGQPGE